MSSERHRIPGRAGESPEPPAPQQGPDPGDIAGEVEWCRKCGKTTPAGDLRRGLCAACVPGEIASLRETAGQIRALGADDSEEIAGAMERSADSLEAAAWKPPAPPAAEPTPQMEEDPAP